MTTFVPLPMLKATGMRDTAADAIRRALLQGRFPPGTPLSELSLASELAVSRGPVREALLILSQEGLVTHQQNRGFFVTQFAPEDQAKIQQVRFPLEVMALESARERTTPSDLDDLRAIKDELVVAYREARISELIPADLKFHTLIWEKSGNKWLAIVLKRVLIPSFVFGIALQIDELTTSWELVDEQHTVYIDYLAGLSNFSAEYCVSLHLAPAEVSRKGGSSVTQDTGNHGGTDGAALGPENL